MDNEPCSDTGKQGNATAHKHMAAKSNRNAQSGRCLELDKNRHGRANNGFLQNSTCQGRFSRDENLAMPGGNIKNRSRLFVFFQKNAQSLQAASAARQGSALRLFLSAGRSAPWPNIKTSGHELLEKKYSGSMPCRNEVRQTGSTLK